MMIVNQKKRKKKKENDNLILNDEEKQRLSYKIERGTRELKGLKEEFGVTCDLRYWPGLYNTCVSLDKQIDAKEKELKDLKEEIVKYR